MLLYFYSEQITAVIFQYSCGTETSVMFPSLFTGWIPQYFWSLFSIAILLLGLTHLCNGRQIRADLVLLMQKDLARHGLFNLPNQRLARNIAAPYKYVRTDMPGKGENSH